MMSLFVNIVYFVVCFRYYLLNWRCAEYNFAEVHQFPRNSVVEFSEYLQLDRMAHWPRIFAPPCIPSLSAFSTNLPRLASGLARFGLGKERWIKVFQFLALCQEQPLCSFLQSSVNDERRYFIEMKSEINNSILRCYMYSTEILLVEMMQWNYCTLHN